MMKIRLDDTNIGLKFHQVSYMSIVWYCCAKSDMEKQNTKHAIYMCVCVWLWWWSIMNSDYNGGNT